MTIQQALTWAINKLHKSSPTSSLDAEVLLSLVLKKPKEFLYTHPETKLTNTQQKKLKTLVSRRAKGEPIAYLTNRKEFYGLDFYVDKRVLIPRPETELLVNKIIELFQVPGSKFQVIADIGTGSGCIAVALAKHLPKAKIIATDISKPALRVARRNARKHGIKIKFFHGSLLQPLKSQKIDIIVANLPYGWKEWKNNTSAETNSLKFEPQKALFTKKNGLHLHRQFFLQLAERKPKPKFTFSEFDPRQKTDLLKMVRKLLPKSKIRIKKDLAGLNRVLIVSC